MKYTKVETTIINPLKKMSVKKCKFEERKISSLDYDYSYSQYFNITCLMKYNKIIISWLNFYDISFRLIICREIADTSKIADTNDVFLYANMDECIYTKFTKINTMNDMFYEVNEIIIPYFRNYKNDLFEKNMHYRI